MDRKKAYRRNRYIKPAIWGILVLVKGRIIDKSYKRIYNGYKYIISDVILNWYKSKLTEPGKERMKEITQIQNKARKIEITE